MFAGGQRKIATNLWHARISAEADCAGFLLNSRGGRFSSSIQKNLIAFVKLAGEIGFDEVQLRFDPLWVNVPRVWKTWDEGLFQENLSLILTTIDLLHGITRPKIFFDLGGEFGGVVWGTVMPRYTQRVWAAALQHTDLDHTDGFSIAYSPGAIERYVEWIRAVGPLPRELSLTIYPNPYQGLTAAAKEARANGYASPRFLIQETFYDDPAEYRDFVRAAEEQHVTIRVIMQWPVKAGGKGITEATTPAYVYGP
jgi:hypothetical protein